MATLSTVWSASSKMSTLEKAGSRMRDFWDNFKHAVRMFRTNPGFTGFAVAALALGIGINSAIFTVVDTVLLKPLTYPDADRIVEFMHVSPDGTRGGASSPDFLASEGQ